MPTEDARSELMSIEATGLSMWPMLRPGDRLLFAPERPADVRVGAVIVYRGPSGQVIAHRLVRKVIGGGRLSFFAKGDGSISSDGPLDEAAYIGTVIAVVRRSSRILDLTGLSHRIVGTLLIRFAPVAALLIAVGKRGLGITMDRQA